MLLLSLPLLQSLKTTGFEISKIYIFRNLYICIYIYICMYMHIYAHALEICKVPFEFSKFLSLLNNFLFLYSLINFAFVLCCALFLVEIFLTATDSTDQGRLTT